MQDLSVPPISPAAAQRCNQADGRSLVVLLKGDVQAVGEGFGKPLSAYRTAKTEAEARCKAPKCCDVAVVSVKCLGGEPRGELGVDLDEYRKQNKDFDTSKSSLKADDWSWIIQGLDSKNYTIVISGDNELPFFSLTN